MDVSSGVTISQALQPESNELILDLCCVPGTKLFYMAELGGKVIGIDNSQQRLNTCKNLSKKKYQVLNENIINLILADSTTIELQMAFDKVLVDVECTHEGSVKHLNKYKQQPSFFEQKVFNKNNFQLQNLQRSLLSKAYQLLKPGGVLVYSTYSLCKFQNQDNIQ